MQLTYYGQSCFMVEVSRKKILFDPFITPNPHAKHINKDDINVDYIFLSYGHGYHYNTFDIIKIDTEKALADFKAAGKTLLLPAIGETITL